MRTHALALVLVLSLLGGCYGRSSASVGPSYSPGRKGGAVVLWIFGGACILGAVASDSRDGETGESLSPGTRIAVGALGVGLVAAGVLLWMSKPNHPAPATSAPPPPPPPVE